MARPCQPLVQILSRRIAANAILALASAFTSNPIKIVAASLIGSAAQKAADAELDKPAAPPAA